MRSLLLFLVFLGHSVAFGQNTDSKSGLNLFDYIFFNKGDYAVYEGKFRNKTSIDTIITKAFQVEGTEGFYAWKNDPPSYMIGPNSFLGGISTVKNDSIFFKAVSWEYNLIKVQKEDFKFLFPKTVFIGESFETENKFGKKMTYKIVDTTSIQVKSNNYSGVLIMEKAVHWDNKINRDTIWLAPSIGCVKWKRSTDRIERLIDYGHNESEGEYTGPSGRIYVNSFGAYQWESEMLDSYHVNSDFSTATYNSEGFLIKEEFYGPTGEMGIEYITYEYDADGNLMKELYFYGDNIWVNLYIYENGKLVRSKHKFDVNDADFYKVIEFDHLDPEETDKERYSTRHKMRKAN